MAARSQKTIYVLEGRLVGCRRIAALEAIRDLSDAWAAFRFVLAPGRHGERLTAIFLRQAQESSIARPCAVKAFDGEDTPPREINDARLGDGQVKRGNELQA